MLLKPPISTTYREAGRIEDVYKITDILTESEIEKLSEASQSLSAEFSTFEAITEGLKAKKFTELLAMALKKHVDEKVDEKLAIAIYIDGIVKFLNMRSSDFSKGPKFLPEFIPLGLRNKIFNVFTDET